VLRHEPQQDDPKSVFNGTQDSPYAWMTRKVATAQEHKAAAVIFCTDELEIRKHLEDSRRAWHEAIDRLSAEHDKLKELQNPTPEQLDAQCRRIEGLAREVEAASKKVEEQCDPLLPSWQGGGGQARADFPVLHCRRAVLDRAVRAALGTDLTGAIASLRDVVDAPLPVDVRDFDHFVFLGSGWTIGLAHEAALKIREAAQAWSESYPGMDYRHGPVAVAGPRSLVTMFGEPPAGLVDTVRATGATVLTDDLDPLVQLVRAQRLAVALAASRSLDPDNPRALTRSVILSSAQNGDLS
jgi:hypothetical protein